MPASSSGTFQAALKACGSATAAYAAATQSRCAGPALSLKTGGKTYAKCKGHDSAPYMGCRSCKAEVQRNKESLALGPSSSARWKGKQTRLQGTHCPTLRVSSFSSSRPQLSPRHCLSLRSLFAISATQYTYSGPRTGPSHNITGRASHHKYNTSNTNVRAQNTRRSTSLKK